MPRTKAHVAHENLETSATTAMKRPTNGPAKKNGSRTYIINGHSPHAGGQRIEIGACSGLPLPHATASPANAIINSEKLRVLKVGIKVNPASGDA